MNVGGSPAVDMIAKWVRAWLHGSEVVVAVGIRQGAPAASEVGIQRGNVGVGLVPVAATGIGLPKLEQCAGDRATILVQHSAVHDNALADGLAGFGKV